LTLFGSLLETYADARAPRFEERGTDPAAAIAVVAASSGAGAGDGDPAYADRHGLEAAHPRSAKARFPATRCADVEIVGTGKAAEAPCVEVADLAPFALRIRQRIARDALALGRARAA